MERFWRTLIIGMLLLVPVTFTACGNGEEVEDETTHEKDTIGDTSKSTSTEEAPPEVSFEPDPQLEADPLLGGKLVIKALVFDVDAQTYTVDLKSLEEGPVAIKYRVHFFDQDGQIFGAATFWSEKEIPGEYTLRLKGIGPKYDASRVRTPTYLAVEVQPM